MFSLPFELSGFYVLHFHVRRASVYSVNFLFLSFFPFALDSLICG